jgi:hypothetical protein
MEMVMSFLARLSLLKRITLWSPLDAGECEDRIRQGLAAEAGSAGGIGGEVVDGVVRLRTRTPWASMAIRLRVRLGQHGGGTRMAGGFEVPRWYWYLVGGLLLLGDPLSIGVIAWAWQPLTANDAIILALAALVLAPLWALAFSFWIPRLHIAFDPNAGRLVGFLEDATEARPAPGA